MALSAVRRGVGAALAAGLVLGGGLVAPAQAVTPPEAGVDEVVGLLGGGSGATSDNLAAWTERLGGIGAFGTPIPFGASSPGGLAGLGTLVKEGIGDQVKGATTWAELTGVDKVVTLADGRKGTLKVDSAEHGDGKQVTVGLTLKRTVADQGLTVSSGSPKVEISAPKALDVTVESTLTVSVVWAGPVSNRVYLVSSAGQAPRVDVDVRAALSGSAKAGVGILEATVASTDLVVTSHTFATISDPNNDGVLGFDAASAGELAASGSLEGLVNAGLDPSGAPAEPDTAGSVAGELSVAVDTSGLPGVAFASPPAADVTVSWADISKGSPTITDTGLAASVGRFQNLSLRDLADGLAQVATALTAVQKAKFAGAGGTSLGDLDLPFLRGTVSDAVKANETLAAFLKANVIQPPDPAKPVDPDFDLATVGKPAFTSLQDLIARLKKAGIGVADLGWDTSTSKLSLRLTMTKAAPGAPVPMDAGAAKVSRASATYAPKGLALVGGDKWGKDAFVGMRVIAGTSAGTIASNDETSLTLTSDWVGGMPTSTNTPFVILGPEAQLGAVSLGDSLSDTPGGAGSARRGILKANAQQTFATITPSVTADLTLVLDLQDPVSLDGCATFPGNTHGACPFVLESGTFKTRVDSLPLPADRVMIRTGTANPLIQADFPIETKVDFVANAGFFQVHLGGKVSVCNSTATTGCNGAATGRMLTIALKPRGDAQHDLRLRDLFAGLLTDGPTGPSLAGNLLDVDLNVGAKADLDVSVPGPGTFFDGKASVKATATWGDITTGAPTFALDNLGEIFALDIKAGSPAELFAIVLRTLQTLSEQLATADTTAGGGVLGKEIPGTGMSLRDLMRRDVSGVGGKVTYGANTLQDESRVFPTSFAGRTVIVGTQVGVVKETDGAHVVTLRESWGTKPEAGSAYTFRSPLDDAIDEMSVHPPQNMQDLVGVLNAKLGSGALGFHYLDDGGTPSLVLDVNWARNYKTATPVRLDLDGVNSLVTVSTSGTGTADVTGTVDVGVVVPLAVGTGATDAKTLKVLGDAKIGVRAKASFEGSAAGTLGPLTVTAGTPADQAVIRADLSVDLAKKAAAAGPVTFKDFIDDLSVAFNKDNAPVAQCESGISTPLMVCARIPIKATVSGSTIDVGTVALRLPDSEDPAELGDLSGTIPGGQARFEVPDLSAALSKAVADFTQIGPGLDGYLEKIEQGLRLATFDGTLPFVGKDLQQGADQIAKLRTELKAVLGAIPASAPAAKAYLNSALQPAVAKVFKGATATVDYTCSLNLEPAKNIVVTPTTKAEGSTKYVYKIIASQGSGSGTDGDTLPSAEGVTLKGAAKLDGENFNTVKWDAVLGVTKYKVLRQNGTGYDLLAVVDKGTLSFPDKGAAPIGTYDTTAVKQAPMLIACPDGAIDGISLAIDVTGAGTSGSVPLDIGIPGLALRAGEGKIDYGLTFDLHVKAAIDQKRGFVIHTHASSAPELSVGATFSLPTSMDAKLAFLDIGVKQNPATPKAPLFGGTFTLDLLSGTGTENASSVVRIADLGSLPIDKLLALALTANVKADWIVTADASSALPGVQANFVLDWPIANATYGQASLGAPKLIAFKDVKIDAGEFFAKLLEPVLKEVKSVTGPIQPVIDTIYAPIPVLSDLSKLAGGGDVSLVTLAKSFNTLAGGPDLAFVDRVVALTKLVNSLPTCSLGSECSFRIGSFTVPGAAALKTQVSPTSAATLVQKGADTLSGEALKTELNKKAGDRPIFDPNDKSGSETGSSGFSFPILDEPASVFGLLMGSDVSLVEFDSGPLTLGFTWRQSFGPVYAPPPVMVTLAGSASVTMRIMAGLDTAGIRHAVEAAQGKTTLKPLDLLDGLYFKTTGQDGKPVPVVQLDGEIAAGAAVTAFIITVGIEGGLHLKIGFYWNDPNNDGKFRVSEFAQAAINNPLCLFTTTGRLSLFLRVYITIGFSPFSTSFSFTLADITLLDFTVQPNCDPPPPRLGGTVDGPDGKTLVVFAGKFGTEAARGDKFWQVKADKPDVVKITELHFAQRPGDLEGKDAGFDGFRVEMLGEVRDYLDPGLKRVVVDGRDSKAPLVVSFVGDGEKENDLAKVGALSAFTSDAVVIGSNLDDQVSMGTGNSWVDGRGGKDRIVTADVAGKVARVAGGGDDDSITTGDGNDLVSGDGALPDGSRNIKVTLNKVDSDNSKPPATTVDLNGVIDWTALDVDPTTGDQGAAGVDIVNVGLGKNRVNGGNGDDKLAVASDRSDGTPTGVVHSQGSTLIGDLGSDAITGGAGPDVIYATVEKKFGIDDFGEPDTLSTKSGKVVPNIIETGSGNDVVYGSRAEDIVTSHSLPSRGGKPAEHADLRGGDGMDALVGGYGTDALYGGPGDDYVISEPSEVGALGTTADLPDLADDGTFGQTRKIVHLPLPEGTASESKLLVGGLGNDHIIGGNGPSAVFGDTLRDGSPAGTYDATCRAGNPVASDAVPEGTSGPAKGGKDGNDLILGGAGDDTISAGGADDRVLAAGGADLVCGQEGNDVLFGGTGADHIWGGSGDDRGFGDSGADNIFGNAGDDFLYGRGGVDVIEGNDGSDWANGGEGDDIVYGGTRTAGRDDVGTAKATAGDSLFGDKGDDRLIGDNGTFDDPLDPHDAAAIPLDLDGTKPDAGRGDLIFGGDGEDIAYGGLGDDQVNGGNDTDHLEGNNGSDIVHGDDGQDEIIGGSFQEKSTGVGRPDEGDQLYGDEGADLITGDNAVITSAVSDADTTRVTRMRGFATNHRVVLLDLGASPSAGTSGPDQIWGGGGEDVIYGQGDTDRIKGGSGDDYAEGGPAIDWVEGNAGDDDLVGGSSTPDGGSGVTTQGQPDTADALWGGTGDDVVLGDNGQILRPLVGQAPTSVTKRLGSTSGQAASPRVIEPWDRSTGSGFLGSPDSSRFGNDQISGGDGVDVLEGQDGDDAITGDGGADYVEGNGGVDRIFGDLPFSKASAHGTSVTPVSAAWPGAASPESLLVGPGTPDGQDDLIGGTPTPGYRDGGDVIEGDGADDVVLGDNGSLLRTLLGDAGSQSERVYTDRYPDGAVPSDATRSRTHDPALPGPSTRFCTTDQPTCEVSGAYGNDTLWGDGGNDGVWGQDGDDRISGGDGDDDLFGELGDDRMSGDAGEDAILGDRGGVVNQHLSLGDSPQQATLTLQNPPKETFVAFERGAYDRRVDLLHDVDGDQWVGGPTDAAMPHPGLTEGGRDQIRGGSGGDNVHAGWGDDVANGDSGGDDVYGDDGEDVLWGGLGCDPVLDAAAPDCLTNGVFDASARGTGDRFIDHIFGGRGEADPAKQDVLGSDILDLRPRGSYEPGTGCTLGDWPLTSGPRNDEVTIDPCLWFEMTDTDDADDANNNHHQGIDWIYGGWDRDVMQGDVAANGPNLGDRLIDWNGAYNLFTHCNAAYGGFNDVRQHSPAMQSFLQQLAWATGAGQTASDVTTSTASAFRELALVYPSDNNGHGSGPAYPGTPGHFEVAACQN